MYEDDGHAAQALARQQYAALLFIGLQRLGKTHIIAKAAGTYPGAAARRLVQLRVARVAAPPAAVLLDGGPLAPAAWQYDAGQHELRLQFSLIKEATITLSDLRLLTQPVANLDPETLTLTAPDSRTFTDEAAIHYLRYVATSQLDTLRIRDQRGRVVRELPTEATPGPHTLPWNGRDAQGRPVPAGLYVAEVAGQHQVLRRLP